MKLVIGLVAGASALCLASSAFAAPLPPTPPIDGVSAQYNFKSENRAAAVGSFRALMQIPEPTKARARGICVSRDNNTEFIVYIEYLNFEDNVTSTRNLLTADHIALQKYLYNSNWKHLINDWNDSIPYVPIGRSNIKNMHHHFSFIVPSKNTDAFIQAAAKIKSQLTLENNGVLLWAGMHAAGGGKNDISKLDVRFIYPDNKNLGIGMDNYFKGKNIAPLFKEISALSTSTISNSIEYCEHFATKK